MSTSQLKVSTRLTLLVGFMSVLLLVISALGLWSTSQSNAALKTVFEDRTVPAAQLGTIKSALFLDRVALSAAVLEPTPEVIKERLQQLENNRGIVAREWKAYMATTLTVEEAKLAASFAESLAALERDGMLPAAQALRNGDIETVRRMAIGTVRTLFKAAEPTLDALVKLQLDVAQAEYTAAEKRSSQVRTASLATLAAALLFSGLVAWWLVRWLGRELGAEPHEAAALARSVAAGRLDVAITLRPGDTGSLMAQLQRMRDSLAEVVGNVRRNAEGVATAATQIAQGNSDLSGRTEEQASALQQTAALMEQLNTTVAQNADNAREANSLAQGASEVAVKGGDAVQQVVHTMRDISTASKRIADITGVVDGIAFQTNILALNAAVEAARAGEQGRGFAVVAGEVRVLARRSADAAKEIKQLIAASVEQVDNGTSLADQAGATIQEAVEAIQRVSMLVAEISTASSEQSSGVHQVGQSMTHMDEATQQNAALVEESAAAADSLSQQARLLVESVSAFQLGTERTGRPAAAAATGQSGSATQPAHIAARALASAKARAATTPAATPAATPRAAQPAAAKPTGTAAPVSATAAAAAPMAHKGEDWESF